MNEQTKTNEARIEFAVAGCELQPGQRVTLLDGLAFPLNRHDGEPGAGIVDPNVVRKPGSGAVQKGSHFPLWRDPVPEEVLRRAQEEEK